MVAGGHQKVGRDIGARFVPFYWSTRQNEPRRSGAGCGKPPTLPAPMPAIGYCFAFPPLWNVGSSSDLLSPFFSVFVGSFFLVLLAEPFSVFCGSWAEDCVAVRKARLSAVVINNLFISISVCEFERFRPCYGVK